MPKPEDWLAKAKSDLNLARKGIEGDDATLDSAVYHTQQCAEKALKAYLLCQDRQPRKIHDLIVLLEQCLRFDKSFIVLKKEAASLNPFSTEFRYPDDYAQFPEREAVEEAIKQAEKIFNFVKDKVFDLKSGQRDIFR